MPQSKQQLENIGKALIGKYAQTRLLTTLNDKGQKILEQPQKITGYTIQEQFKNPVLMVIIDGVEIFEELLINIH